MVGLFLGYGAPRVEVGDGWLRAGRARIAGEFLGEAEPLDAAETRRVAGPGADARAYLLLRPYLKRASGDRARRPRPHAVLAGEHPRPRAPRHRHPGDLAAPGPRDSLPAWLNSGGSKLWTVFSLVSALGAAALAKKALDTGWQRRDRQAPAGEPRRPRRPDGRGDRLGGGRAAPSSRSRGCSPSAGRRTTTGAPPATCPRSSRRTDPGTTKPARSPGRAVLDGGACRLRARWSTRPGLDSRSRPRGLSRGSLDLLRRRARSSSRPPLRQRSRGRSSASRPRAGCGDGPGSSSCT